MSDLSEGDMVCLRPSEGWHQPWRKFAAEGRVGQIAKVFTPVGDRDPTVCVRFLPKRKGAEPKRIFLQRNDLIAAPTLSRPRLDGGEEA